MARVSAFGTMRNEHREVSVGGRSRNNSIRAWLNCDTQDGEVDVTVEAYVSGRETARERRRGDDRHASFIFTLRHRNTWEDVERAATYGLNYNPPDDFYRHMRLCRELKDRPRADPGVLPNILANMSSMVPPVSLPGGWTLREAYAARALLHRLGYDVGLSDQDESEPAALIVAGVSAPAKRRLLPIDLK